MKCALYYKTKQNIGLANNFFPILQRNCNVNIFYIIQTLFNTMLSVTIDDLWPSFRQLDLSFLIELLGFRRKKKTATYSIYNNNK